MLQSILLGCFMSLSILISAQQQNDLKNSVQVNASYSKVNETISLNWENYAQATEYQIYERNIGSTTWGSPIATVSTDTFYVITNVDIGNLMEYKVLRVATDGTAEGYTYSGIEYLPQRFGNKSIIVTEAEIRDSLSIEIERYITDVKAEGWTTTEVVVNKEITAEEVKNAILEVYNTDPNNYKMLTIIGHVPVPYSGNIGPDGHSNHNGAWPCDGYYGDTNGNWTDSSVNNTSASQTRNHNIPGDGKWDQSSFPSQLEMAVGRIDFSNLPLFEESEIELTKRYLDKNHAFRIGELRSISRGVVENNFNLAEGFGQNGYRNISALVGRDSTFSRNYDALKSETYLWSYGAGSGTFQSAGGISSTTNFAKDSIQGIFTMLFGSYFGDFDSSNNFLRAALATGTVLSNVWAGRPHWHFHPMGMGSRLGDCTLLTMNNSSYTSGYGNRLVHMALMGDPLLKMSYIQSPNNITSYQQGNNIQLNWEASSENNIEGYHIYRMMDNETPELLDTLISGLSYIDRCIDASEYTYYVSAVQLKEGFTGSYFNESPHISTEISISEIITPSADFTYSEDELEVTLMSNAMNAISHNWDFGDGNTSNEINPVHTYEGSGIYNIKLTVRESDNCFSDSITQEINLMPSSVFESELHNTIFPNPAIDILQLRSNNTIQQITIIDLTGKKIVSQYYNQKDVSISIESFPSGMFYLSILMKNNKSYQSKFVKQ